MGKLTIKQEKFCNKYLECGNASEAYRYAYRCSNMSDNTVWNNAYLLLQNSEVAARIEYLKTHLAEAAGISALQIIREHQKIAFSDATRIRNGWMSLKEFESLTDDEKACIKSINTKHVGLRSAEGGETIRKDRKSCRRSRRHSNRRGGCVVDRKNTACRCIVCLTSAPIGGKCIVTSCIGTCSTGNRMRC